MIDDIQAALHAVVKGIAGLDVFGHVPQDFAGYPYVVVNPMRLNSNDYDSETGFDGSFQIDVWSEYKGSRETADIQKLIYNALHRAPLTVIGWGISTVQQEFTNILLDPDGITRHGVQRFRIIFEPTA